MGTLTTSERQRLDRDGYLALKGIVEPKRVKAMQARLEELLVVTDQEHAGCAGPATFALNTCEWKRPLIS